MKFKRSEMCLAVFYELLQGEVLTVSMITKKVHCSRNTAYLILMDIDVFIADFNHYELEIIKEGKRFYLKK